MSIDEWTREATSWTSYHGGDPLSARQRQLAMAWDQAARDARQLVVAYRQAGVPTIPAFYSPTGHRRDRVWMPVWPLVDYQPRRSEYLNTVDGRAFGTTTVAEVPGIALLPDGALSEYVMAKRHPMLTVPLRQARPNNPPSYATLAARLPR